MRAHGKRTVAWTMPGLSGSEVRGDAGERTPSFGPGLGGAAGRSARAVSGLRKGALGRLVGSIGRRTRPAVRPVAPNRRMALGPPRRHTARDPRDVGEAAGAEDRRGDAG